MEDSGIICTPRRPSGNTYGGRPVGSAAFSGCTYYLTHPWYAKALPQKLHVQAGRPALAVVARSTRHNLAPRVYSAPALDTFLALFEALFNDPYVTSVSIKNLPKEEHPTITVLYDERYPRSNPEDLNSSHEFVYETLRGYIAAMPVFVS